MNSVRFADWQWRLLGCSIRNQNKVQINIRAAIRFIPGKNYVMTNAEPLPHEIREACARILQPTDIVYRELILQNVKILKFPSLTDDNYSFELFRKSQIHEILLDINHQQLVRTSMDKFCDDYIATSRRCQYHNGNLSNQGTIREGRVLLITRVSELQRITISLTAWALAKCVLFFYKLCSTNQIFALVQPVEAQSPTDLVVFCEN